jgi:hypothetical protein
MNPLANPARLPLSIACISLLANASTLASPPVAEQHSRPTSARPVQIEGMPKLPSTPSPVLEIVEAVPFVLDASYTHDMRKDQRDVTRGHVLVLRCDPAYLLRRQTAEPVLVAGAETGERINIGFESGLLVVIVPEWKAKGKDGVEQAVDPVTTPIYFATPELPERVDAAWIAAEGAKAQAAGIGPAPLRADARGAARSFADRDALNRFLAGVVERHAPTEGECVAALRGDEPKPVEIRRGG